MFPFVWPAPHPVSVQQCAGEGGGGRDGAGGEGPDSECGGRGDDRVLPAARNRADGVAVGVDADGDRLSGLCGVSVGTAAVRSPWGVDQRARAVFWAPAVRRVPALVSGVGWVSSSSTAGTCCRSPGLGFGVRVGCGSRFSMRRRRGSPAAPGSRRPTRGGPQRGRWTASGGCGSTGTVATTGSVWVPVRAVPVAWFTPSWIPPPSISIVRRNPVRCPRVRVERAQLLGEAIPPTVDRSESGVSTCGDGMTL